MPNQHSAHNPLRYQNQSKNLPWATCFSFFTWPHPSQQVNFAGLACFTGPGLAGPQTGLGFVTGLATEVEGQAQGGTGREQ